MSDPAAKAPPGPAVAPDELEHGELVAADDAVIGRALRWSAVAVVVVGAAVAAMLWYMKRAPEVLPVVVPTVIPAQEVTAAADPPTVGFTDITAQAGIDFVHTSGATGEKLMPETMGSGAAFFDFDSDGDQDLLLVNGAPWPWTPESQRPAPAPTAALYRNDGRGAFTNVTSGSGLDVSFYGVGVATGDYDNDGDVDVFVTAVGPNRLFRNDGGGRFTDVTAGAGVAGDEGMWSTSAGFFDYDNDGRLDLFVGNYIRWTRDIDFAVDYRLTGVGRAYGPPMNFEGTHSYLYRNRGDGSFEDVSAAAGIQVNNPATGQPAGKALGVSMVDIDRDGWMDLLVANDTVANFLFINQGASGTTGFVEEGAPAGVAYDRNGSATGAMGIDTAYYRNDGVSIGFAIGNFANEMSSLYVSQGDRRLFADEAITEGLGAPTRRMLTFGVMFLDYDLDGRLDLFHANGHIEDEINTVQPSQHYEQPSQLFWNCGPKAKACFAPVDPTAAGDLGKALVGRGSAFADIDADGDLDLVITQVGRRPVLLRNDQELGHEWVRVKLVGTKANRDAIGAIVELQAGGITQRQQVMPTRSYLSQSELPVTFGLGAAKKVDAVRILWPGGAVQELSDEAAGRQIVATQP